MLRLFLDLLIAILGFFVLIPLGIMVIASFSGDPFALRDLSLDTYANFFTSSRYVNSLANSLIVGLLATIIAIAIGVPLAWLVARTNVLFKELIKYTIVIPYIVPPYIYAMAWILVASPYIGILNNITYSMIGVRPFNIYSFEGMSLVLGLYTMPFVFMNVYTYIRMIDYSLEEQSIVCGANIIRTFASITFRLLTPAIAVSFILIYILSIELFTIPLLLGYPSKLYTLPAVIFIDLYATTPPKYALGAISSVILLILMAMLMYIYIKVIGYERKYVTISGKGFRTGEGIDLGRYRYLIGSLILIFIIVTIYVPISILIIHSFSKYWGGNIDPRLFTLENYSFVLSDNYFINSLRNTIILGMVSVPSIALMGLIIAYLVSRVNYVERKALDLISTIPYTIPGYIFSLALLISWAAYIPLSITGTLLILWLALLIRYLPFAVRINSAGILAISPDLDEASIASGASRIATLKRIILPLLKGPLAVSMIVSYIYSIRDVGAVLFLVTGSTMVIPVQVLFYWFNGSWNYASAASVIQILLTLPAFILLIRNIDILVGEKS